MCCTKRLISSGEQSYTAVRFRHHFTDEKTEVQGVSVNLQGRTKSCHSAPYRSSRVSTVNKEMTHCYIQDSGDMGQGRDQGAGLSGSTGWYLRSRWHECLHLPPTPAVMGCTQACRKGSSSLHLWLRTERQRGPWDSISIHQYSLAVGLPTSPSCLLGNGDPGSWPCSCDPATRVSDEDKDVED